METNTAGAVARGLSRPALLITARLGDPIINSRRIVSRLEMLKHNSLHDSNPSCAGYVVRIVSGRVISFADATVAAERVPDI